MMQPRDRFLQLGFRVFAVVWSGAVRAQTGRVKLTLKGQWPGYSTGEAQAVAVNGPYAYCAVREGGLMILDLSNPAKPQRVGGYDTSGDAFGVAVLGNYAYMADHDAGLLVFEIEITELPAITRAERSGNALVLEWNEPGKGMRLQRATRLTNPDWVEMLGSENTNRVTLPLWSGNEFFRLMKP